MKQFAKKPEKKPAAGGDLEANDRDGSEQLDHSAFDDGRLTPALVEGSNEVPMSRSKFAGRGQLGGRRASFGGGREKEDRRFLSEGYRREEGVERGESSNRE
jgi:hypothetical protein